ncbi:helix-turn-helix domain-containing protein [Mangrovibacterium diazotrophicum]|uniref:Excisionase family DNA binding protein n=1 Tax=Mangrovibacterium diazotrophicum TaxID=1261403 RepID=A0A419WAQ4_9BACT|nr:helix-turn-helix domain-containing protein [Mangrovibacterium diazotrophicum]RKD92533.1 excisionase family DNA binding protein [Mangrovibacterium diazotrophicum]
MELKDFHTKLDRIEKAALAQKNVLTFDEAANYIGISKSDLYKRTSSREIPHFKPRGKMIYFDRVQLEQYLKQNPISTIDSIDAQASKYVTINMGGSK